MLLFGNWIIKSILGLYNDFLYNNIFILYIIPKSYIYSAHSPEGKLPFSITIFGKFEIPDRSVWYNNITLVSWILLCIISVHKQYKLCFSHNFNTVFFEDSCIHQIENQHNDKWTDDGVDS